MKYFEECNTSFDEGGGTRLLRSAICVKHSWNVWEMLHEPALRSSCLSRMLTPVPSGSSEESSCSRSCRDWDGEFVSKVLVMYPLSSSEVNAEFACPESVNDERFVFCCSGTARM